MSNWHVLALRWQAGNDPQCWTGPGLVNTRDMRTFYHRFGPSYMTLSPKHYEVMHDYGMIDIAERELTDPIEIDFARRFYRPKAQILDSPGWLSPDGKYYPCHSWEHDSLADNLVACRERRLADNAPLHLEKTGWVKVYGKFVAMRTDNRPLTQTQIDTLWELAQIANPELAEACRFAIANNEEME